MPAKGIITPDSTKGSPERSDRSIDSLSGASPVLECARLGKRTNAAQAASAACPAPVKWKLAAQSSQSHIFEATTPPLGQQTRETGTFFAGKRLFNTVDGTTPHD